MNHSKFVSAAAIGLLGLAAPFMVAQAATYTAEEKANIKAVADFYAALDARDAAGGESKMPIRPILEKYIKEDYIQHMAGQEQGREGLAKLFTGRAGGRWRAAEWNGWLSSGRSASGRSASGRSRRTSWRGEQGRVHRRRWQYGRSDQPAHHARL
jgi:hypothetical protein